MSNGRHDLIIILGQGNAPLSQRHRCKPGNFPYSFEDITFGAGATGKHAGHDFFHAGFLGQVQSEDKVFIRMGDDHACFINHIGVTGFPQFGRGHFVGQELNIDDQSRHADNILALGIDRGAES
ncbi:MAG: hypothetical protein A4E71_03022 [Smithella sp. PtaU1.Bin162]|nr:MAG: hypothetical protein A4E71_03022 [Smithella sp. PtaU1.Bin162]